MRWRPTGSSGPQSPTLYDQCHARSGTTASTRASCCPKPSALAYHSRVGGNSRRGSFLPSACLFLQKGGNGSRTSRQHSCRPWKTKPFPESFCFVASTEPPALLEKRNHLARESLKPLGVNVHKHVEAVGRPLVHPLLHKVDNLLRGADKPIMSATASGDNLTNGDGSVLQQTVSRCPVSG